MPNYDLAVAGAGLAGLAAAAAASKSRKRVVVLDPGTTAGGVLSAFEKDGFRFVPGPHVVYGFERGGPVQSGLEGLGVRLVTTLRSPSYQVLLPDRRVTIFAEQAETLDELQREFPGEIDRIARLYQDMRKQAQRCSRSRLADYLSRRRNAQGVLRNRGLSHEFTVFLDVQARHFFGTALAALPMYRLVALIDTVPFAVAGGFSHLAEELVSAVLKNQGEILHGVRFDGSTLRPRTLVLPEGTLSADTILLNFPEVQLPRICLALQEQVVPVGMLSEAICTPDYSRPDRHFALSVSAKDDRSAAPAGKRAVTAVFSAACAQMTPQERLREIARIIPFLDRFTLFAEEWPTPDAALSVPPDLPLRPVRSSRGKLAILRRNRKYSAFVVSDDCSVPSDQFLAGSIVAESVR